MSGFRCAYCGRPLSLRRLSQGATMHTECVEAEVAEMKRRVELFTPIMENIATVTRRAEARCALAGICASLDLLPVGVQVKLIEAVQR